MVNITDVKQILQFAIDAEIKVFLDGGWGVDALLGYQSRAHNDIDIFVEKNDYQNFIEIMKANGFYEIKMEYTTLNHTVWEDLKNRIIDLHCFEYTDEGEILYDGDCFPVGERIGMEWVLCSSVIIFSFFGKSVLCISLFNCVGFSNVGFSNVGFSCVGLSNVGFSNVGKSGVGGCGCSNIT